MNDYKVGDYGIFTNAINTAKALSEKVTEGQAKVKEAETTLSNQAVYMGPAQENTMQALNSANTKMSAIITTMGTISGYLEQTSTSYQAGDQTATETVTQVGSTNTVSTDSQTYINGGTMRGYNFRNQNFNVVNTKIPIETYEEYVQKKGLNQNAGLLGGDCMLLSQYYATDLLRGTYTSKGTMAATQGAPATRINERCKSTNADDVLNYTYKELSEGHPVVLQVSQIHSDQGLRHLVTAVGYDSSVTSAKDLTPDKILVLDCVDGKIQTLGQARSEGGHERRLYAQGGNYQALGPTETFLSKEVNKTTQTVTA